MVAGWTASARGATMRGRERRMATTGSPAPGITAVRVGGFKSLRDPVDLAIRPLTLLAGQNSAGKSSEPQVPERPQE